MSLKTIIIDSLTKVSATIDKSGALLTTSTPLPAPDLGQENKQQFYSAVLGSTGADSGTINQNVDGSVTPQEFRIDAHLDYDIHILQISIILADSSVVHNKFGAISALANGFDVIVTESGLDTYIISKAKSGGQLIARSGFSRAFGDSGTAFELLNWTGTDDAQIINVPIGEWVPNGLRIGRGTTDKLTSMVNDDLTGLTDFTVRVFGYKNIPIEV